MQFPQLFGLKGGNGNHYNGHASAKDNRWDKAHNFSRHTRLELPYFVGRANEYIVHRRNPSPHFIGRHKLNDGSAYNHADAVESPAKCKDEHGKVKVGRKGETNHADAKACYTDEQVPACIMHGRLVNHYGSHGYGAYRRSSPEKAQSHRPDHQYFIGENGKQGHGASKEDCKQIEGEGAEYGLIFKDKAHTHGQAVEEVFFLFLGRQWLSGNSQDRKKSYQQQAGHNYITVSKPYHGIY